MLKSQKGYSLAQNVKGKIQSTFIKILAVVFISAALVGTPAVLTSCGQDTAVHESLPSVSVKEMNAFVSEYFKFPPVGNLANPTSLAYSFAAQDGKVYEIKIISTSNERDGSVPVYITTLEFGYGLTQEEIEKKNASPSCFSNSTVKIFNEGESVELDEIYDSILGEDYIVSKEYKESRENGIEL